MKNVLKFKDPVLDTIIKREYMRQRRSMELIASENFVSLLEITFYIKKCCN